MKTVIRLQTTCYCTSCGELFQYKKRRSWFLKTVLSFTEIKKFYCVNCDTNYYVHAPAVVKVNRFAIRN